MLKFHYKPKLKSFLCIIQWTRMIREGFYYALQFQTEIVDCFSSFGGKLILSTRQIYETVETNLDIVIHISLLTLVMPNKLIRCVWCLSSFDCFLYDNFILKSKQKSQMIYHIQLMHQRWKNCQLSRMLWTRQRLKIHWILHNCTNLFISRWHNHSQFVHSFILYILLS